LLAKHKILTPFVFWSRIQYYTFTTFTLYFVWLFLTDLQVDIPFLYTADCRYGVAASLATLSLMYHIIVRPGAIKTQRLNDISYEHFSFYNYVFHYYIPLLTLFDYFFLVDRSSLHWQALFGWMIYPAFYVVFVYWRAWMTKITHGKSHLYPYDFMDPNQRSILQIAKGVLIVGAQFFSIGLFVYLVSMGMTFLGIPPVSWTWNGPF
jgi:hypothetical protein